jgi:hypothetical protein
MDYRFKRIASEHILRACDEIVHGKHRDFANSTRYSVVHEGCHLPPKAVISRAYFHTTGTPLPVQGEGSFSGGAQSNDFLRNHGFTIVNVPSDHNLSDRGKKRQ